MPAVPPRGGADAWLCASSWRRTTRTTSTGWSGAAAAASCRPPPSTFRPSSAERLFDKVDTVVLTSATLAVAGGVRIRAEAPGPGERPHAGRARATSIIRSRRCSTCRSTCPSRAARLSPRRPPTKCVRFCEHSRGRAFVLFTSYQQMRLVYDSVSLEIEYPTLLQGTGPRTRCSTSSAPRPTACCSRLPRSGRAWTCRASS